MATTPPDERSSPLAALAADLRTAWGDHRTYLLVSVALFALGSVIGVGLVVAEVDLLAAMGLDDLGEVFPETPTVSFILINNTRVFLLFVAGALTLGLLTVVGLLFNGILVGYVASIAAASQGPGFVVVGLAPHGILELPALFVASAVGFRILHRAVVRVVGDRERVLSRAEWKRTGLLLLAAWVALAVAAVVEIHVTGRLLEALYGAGV